MPLYLATGNKTNIRLLVAEITQHVFHAIQYMHLKVIRRSWECNTMSPYAFLMWNPDCEIVGNSIVI
jgi:hypothetical protein